MTHLNDANTTSHPKQRTVIPQSTSHVHMSMQRRASGEVDGVEYHVHVLSRPGHLLPTLIIGSGSAHGEGDLGASIGERGMRVVVRWQCREPLAGR